MVHPKPYPRCIFCGTRANSREHAVPAWIARRLGVRDFLDPETALIHQVEQRKQPISFASHRARILCADCNRHFKRLEDAVIPLLVPMARGRVLSLGPEHQALLALWAAKTAIAIIAATTPELRDVVPVDHRRSIRNYDRPVGESWIGYFPWRGDPVIVSGLGAVAAADGPAADTYVGVLAFAKLGIAVTGFTETVAAIDVLDGQTPALLRFWPPRSSLVHWPPVGAPLGPGAALAGLLSRAPIRRRS